MHLAKKLSGMLKRASCAKRRLLADFDEYGEQPALLDGIPAVAAVMTLFPRARFRRPQIKLSRDDLEMKLPNRLAPSAVIEAAIKQRHESIPPSVRCS